MSPPFSGAGGAVGYALPATPTALSLGDVDGDGTVDVLAAAGTELLILHTGATAQPSRSPASPPSSPT